MAIWSLKGKKVLIIDDFQEIRVLLKGMIEPLAPALINMAQNGEEALEQMEQQQYDVIFCDYNLGKGKDGQQVLEQAKHSGLLGYDCIYIMCTAENTSDMVMGAIEYQPDDYISKPFNRTVIHARLKKQLEKKDNLVDIARAMGAKQYKKALQHCDELLSKQPPNRYDLYKIKGEILVNLSEYDKAADMYEDIIEERDIPWVYLALGKVRYLQKQYEEALEIFQELVNENSSNVAAYDWLASTHEAMGDSKQAQDMLAQGVAKSPKSFVRQRRLAQVAYDNGDLDTATSAFEQALHVGHHSCYKRADDYNSLAKTYLEKDDVNKAMQMVDKLEKDYKTDSNAMMVGAVTKGMIHTSNNDSEAANRAIESALELYKQNPQELSSDIALELTDLCLTAGKEDAAQEITMNLVRNNHDNEKLLEKTKAIYAKSGHSDIGASLIEKATKEIIELNNKGARLLKEGKLEESIELFMKAARGMPDNAVVNLNAAYAMLMHMKKTGRVKKYGGRVSNYLERVNALDPTNQKYHELLELLQQLVEKKNVA